MALVIEIEMTEMWSDGTVVEDLYHLVPGPDLGDDEMEDYDVMSEYVERHRDGWTLVARAMYSDRYPLTNIRTYPGEIGGHYIEHIQRESVGFREI